MTTDEKKRKTRKMWIDAWYDPLAASCAISSCMTLADINGDGDFKLVLAYSGSNPLQLNNFGSSLDDHAKGLEASLHKLKVFKGAGVISENTLIEEPIAVCSYYIDYNMPRRPVIAVGTAKTLYLYRNMQPYYRFYMPHIRASTQEKDLWKSVREGEIGPMDAFAVLAELRDEQRVKLTDRSMELLSLTEEDDIQEFIANRKGEDTEQQTHLTCMAVLNKDKEEEDSIGCPVLGCENQTLYVLEPSAAKVIQEFDLPAVPFMISCAGRYDVEHRIAVACRNGKVYIIRNHALSGVVIDLQSIPCSVAQHDRVIVVACMDNSIRAYNHKGKLQYTIHTGHPIKDMTVLDMRNFNHKRCIAVALGNRELRVYNGGVLVDSVETGEVVSGMTYGIYGSEPNTLVLSYRTGGIEYKIVSRKAPVDGKTKSGPPPEQDIPLNLPKRTSLYMELTEREKQLATDMHRVFQRELCKLRVTTSRAFLRVLTEGQGPVSFTSGSDLRLNATVQGLGPLFRIKLQLHNTGTQPKLSIPIVFLFDKSIYSISKRRIVIPALAPSLQYRITVDVEQIDEQAGSDNIRILLLNSQGNAPLITAVLQMPLMMNMGNS